MKQPGHFIRRWVAGLVFLMAVGCSTTPKITKETTTPLQVAQDHIPQEDLLDIGITLFDPGEVTEKIAEKSGTHEDIRAAEAHFMPFHLKTTLENTGYFGSVRVLPVATFTTDVQVRGRILYSNGERLELEIEVEDASGYVWFKREYRAKAQPTSFTGVARGEHDLFQDVYNRIANDIVAYLLKLPVAEIHRVREVARLRFAQEFSPEAFGGYLTTNKRGRQVVQRLPAQDDPQLQRILKIRERDGLFVETLNQFYDVMYRGMWPSYENWRKFNLAEIEALKEVRRQAITQQVAGVLLLALAVALEVGDVKEVGSSLSTILILAGGQVLMNGINISQQAEMHKAALQELSDSFGADSRPIRLELEGKIVELNGSAQEKYAAWRELLRRLYIEETGFPVEEAMPAGAAK